MNLQDSAVYRTPDGRRFRARKERREPAWILVPLGSDEEILHTATRDRLAQILLVLENGKIVFLDFSGIDVVVRETDWTVDELSFLN